MLEWVTTWEMKVRNDLDGVNVLSVVFDNHRNDYN